MTSVLGSDCMARTYSILLPQVILEASKEIVNPL